MVFNSFKFAIFMFVIFILYWLIPKKYRSILLLASSYTFISFSDIRYSIILFLITLITFIAAIYIYIYRHKEKLSKLILVFTIVFCVLVLFSFKYIDITQNIFISVFNNNSILKDIILPVGISFYTLEAISYLIDVYKGKIEPERNFVYYACYLCFFPTISSGPIEKAKNIIDQIKNPVDFNYEKTTYGLKLFALGLFKKMVLADRIAAHIDQVFANVSHYYGFASILAAALYGIQIYADFSGYSDMAVGVAKMLGIDIIDNFNAPYFSTTIKEFWSKWHISLSSWLKEYIYIPLGGNRCSKFRNYLNLLLTFLISGLWHGGTLNYLIWGLIHGLLQVFENMFGIKPVDKKYSLKWFVRCGILYTVICIAWLFFRCSNISDVLNILNIKHLIEMGTFADITFYFKVGMRRLDIDIFTIGLLFIMLSITIICDYEKSKGEDIINKISNMKTVYRWGIYVALCLIIIFLSKGNVTTSFIYMGF